MKNPIIRPRLFPVAAGLSTALIVIAATCYISVSEQRHEARGERLQTLHAMSAVRARLEGTLNSRLLLANSIASYIAIHGDVSHETFQLLAKIFVGKDDMIRNISLPKNTVIVDVCPVQGNEKAIGVDLGTIQGQRETVQRAIETRQPVIAGPVNLVQGDIGIISRIPIFLTPIGDAERSGPYWGQTSVVIMQDFLFKEVGILDPESGLKYAVRGKDGLGSEGAIFWGDESVFYSNPVVMNVALPGGAWQMAAIPKSGWGAHSGSPVWFYLVGGFLGVSAGWLIWSLLVTKKTLEETLMLERSLMEQASESETKYRTLFESANDAMFTMKGDRFVDCNKASLTIFGCERQQMVGNHPYTFSPPVQPDGRDSTEKAQEKISLAMSGKAQFFEWKHSRYDGTPFDAEVTLNGLEVNGELMLLATARDITDRKRAEEEIRRSLSLLHSTLESTADGILVVDREGKIVIFNSCFIDMWQIPEGVIESRDDARALASVLNQLTNPDAFLEKVNELYGQPEAKSFDEIQFKDGRIFERYSLPQKIEDEVVGRVWSFRNVTERKKAEAALKESEQMLRGILSTSPVGIGLTQDRTIRWANETWLRMFGFENEQECIGKNARMLYPSEEAFQLEGSRLYSDLEAGRVTGTDTIFQRRDGSVFAAHIRMKLVDPSSPEKMAISAITDITERKQAEEALRVSEEGNRVLIEASPIGITIVRDGRFIYVNPAYVTMMGCRSPEEIIGKSALMFVAPEDRDTVIEKFRASQAIQNGTQNYQVSGIKKSGEPFDVTVWSRFTRYLGSPAVLSFVVDVTEETRLRAQLIQAHKMEAIGILAGGVAHDFNNLLQVVLGYSQLILAKTPQGSSQHENLQKINAAARRGAGLVKELLTFSRKTPSIPCPLDLNHEITKVRALLERTIPKMIKIELELQEDLSVIQADPTQIEQIILNLTINARDAMPEGGMVIIETRNVFLDQEYCKTHLEANPGTYVMLSVIDTGHGMDKEVLEHIFDPFYTTKEVGKGTGLGLSMVYGIVKQHGGYISCESQPGMGTCFRIYFPAVKKLEEEQEEQVDVLTPIGGAETVLLVDDEEFVIELGSDYLRQAGYSVLTASNGREALDMYQKYQGEISLVILDLIMPQMGGRQCFKELLEINPNVKVLIASGHSSGGTIKEAAHLGAGGFIEKPFDMRALLNKVRQVLDTI